MTDVATNNPVILFDGVCNLCSGAVQFIIKRDKKNIFQFSSLQSEYGQAVLKNFNLQHSGLSSFVLYTDGKIFTKSTAAFMVVRTLTGPIKLLYGLIIIPKFIRDIVYDIISKYRYNWFGQKSTCWLPDTSKTIKLF